MNLPSTKPVPANRAVTRQSGRRAETRISTLASRESTSKLWALSALVTHVIGVVSCGMEPKVVTEYYIEDGKTADANGTSAKGSTGDSSTSKTAGGELSSQSKLGSLALTLEIPKVIGGDVTSDRDGQSVAVKIRSSGTAANEFTWSLFYAASGENPDRALIADQLTAATTTLNWNLKDLAGGTYTLYAIEEGFDEEPSAFFSSATTFLERESSSGNSPPNLRLVAPNGENVFVAGSDNTISFTGSDPDGDDLVYGIDYSADNGVTWTNLTDNLTEQSYVWSAAGLAQGITYKVRVTATDPAGATAVASSAKAFGLALTPMTFAAGFGTMLDDNCGGCHRAGGRNSGQFRSDSYDLANLGVADKMMNIKNRIEADEMPTAAPLAQTGKEILTMWLWNGGE